MCTSASVCISCATSLALSPGIFVYFILLCFFYHLGMSACIPEWERIGVHFGKLGVREDLGGVGGEEFITMMCCMKKYFFHKNLLSLMKVK